jgi:glycine cleavage system H protein
MSDLVFRMGAYEARFPTDRAYCTNHLWAQPQGQAHRFGFTAYAVRLLQDVYFLEWCVDEDSHLRQRQTIGCIESKKAESDLYAPADGRLVRFNAALLDDPSAINVDNYGSGWLFELQVSGDNLLSPEEYLQHLDSVWEITQRTIKGQYGKTDGGGPFPGPEQ